MSESESVETSETAAAEAAQTPQADAQVQSPTEAQADAQPQAAQPTDEPTGRANRRKVREGLVVSTAMDKTAVVAVTERVRHQRYAKTVQRTRKLYVHDEENQANDGDRVRVAETRPLSKTKRWRLVEILERAR